MFLIAAQMLLNRTPPASSHLPGAVGLSFVGTIIGAISALVAIGGGTMTVPFLTWREVRLPAALATSAAVGLPRALTGALGFSVNGAGTGGLPPDSIDEVY